MRVPNVYGISFCLSIYYSYYVFKTNYLKYFDNINEFDLEFIYIFGAISLISGGRIMCALQNDIKTRDILKVHYGGLSSFGSFYSFLIYSYIISKIYQENTLLFIECNLVTVQYIIIGVRIGNYANNELIGKYSNVLEKRHPSQLYQLGLEGVLFNFILWNLNNSETYGIGNGYIYLISPIIYSSFRIFCEFFKEEEGGVPKWFEKYLHKYLRVAQFQALVLPFNWYLFYFIFI